MPGILRESSASPSMIRELPSCWSKGCGGRWRFKIGRSCSTLRGDTIDGLLTGGGDRSLGDIGQRGVSLSSDGRMGFWGTGALIVVSEGAGLSEGMVVAERARCCAATDGGFVLVLVERDGLTSLALFFFDLPGPTVRAEVLALRGSRTGDDSLEGMGEFEAELALWGSSLLVAGIDESRKGFVVVVASIVVDAG